MTPRPTLGTLAELRAASLPRRSVREEIRANLLRRLAEGGALFPGIIGYDDTVMPAVENALLCGHDLIFLGERGQAKSRMIRALVGLLDEWLPEVAGSEIHDDPFAPVSAYARATVAERGDATEIAWVHRDDRYVEKLATPDVSIADLIGDVDPVKVAAGRSLSDELTIHFGLLPRTHRGIFCINELPDLTEKVQVGLFNVMQERDVQVKGYRVRLPLDVLVVASANPEDYTSRGRIITPLKDRYAAQIRTHYPTTRELELDVVRQEARVPQADASTVHVPRFMEELVAEITLQARSSPDVNQTSGVSVRMSIANYETLVANALRRALRCGEGEAVPRISDLDALVQSTAGKLELEYAGEAKSDADVVRDLMQARHPGRVRRLGAGRGGRARGRGVRAGLGRRGVVRAAVRRVPGGSGGDPRACATSPRGSPAATPPRASRPAIEFVLEGLHLRNRLNKSSSEGGSRYARA